MRASERRLERIKRATNPRRAAQPRKAVADPTRGNVSGDSVECGDADRRGKGSSESNLGKGDDDAPAVQEFTEKQSAKLTREEKNFLDYLVKQALRSVLDKDAAPEPDITPHKDET
jgi:hypothetical protein